MADTPKLDFKMLVMPAIMLMSKKIDMKIDMDHCGWSNYVRKTNYGVGKPISRAFKNVH
jgi:hypothetical protein